MKIILNGRETDFAGAFVDDIIVCYSMKKDEIVVEKNGMIVHREHYGTETLSEGDVLEIVSFVGGG